jgi:hypothetical protein
VATARLVSSRHYRLDLRLAVTAPMLKPVDDFFAAEERQAQVGVSTR